MAMIHAVVTATAALTVGLGMGSPAATAGPDAPERGTTIQGEVQIPRGVLRVQVIGEGKYTVIGKGVRRTADRSRSFLLQPGRYRVKAPGADRAITPVRIRPGHRQRVVVEFTEQVGPVGVVSRISTAADGGEGDWSSLEGLFSPDGKQVLIISKATNLVPDFDVNGDELDLYIKTLATGEIERVSTNSQGEQGNRASTSASWSPDGTKIVFDSIATNLVPDDTNRAPDVFVKDLATGAVQRVSTDARGRQVKGSQSNQPAWSPDGTRIAFDSYAPTLVPNDTNRDKDVFVKTLATGAIQRISVDAKGRQCEQGSWFPMWAPDGQRVMMSTSCAFDDRDTNKGMDGYVKSLSSGKIEPVTTTGSGAFGSKWAMPDGWSADGRRVAFTSDSPDMVPDDTNGGEDVFVKDLATGDLRRVSTDSAGQQVSAGSANSRWSPDGKRLGFTSAASELVPGDTNGKDDVFVKTLATGEVQRLSATADGEQGDDDTMSLAWSPDGEQATIVSFATNLVPDDTNEWFDVFLVNAQ